MADDTSVPPGNAVPPTEGNVAYTMGALQDKLDQANNYYEKVMKQITKLKDDKMAEVMSPGGIMMGGGDGGLGFGSGGGLIGGLILGSLLRNGNGGLFGADGNGGGAAALTGQATANMQLMQSIGAVDKAVAVSQAAMEASQANQSLGLTNQFNNTTGSLAARIEGVKDLVNGNSIALMQQLNAVQSSVDKNSWNLNQQITQDGDKTRALIVQQYEATLNRQLTDANAEIIELRGDARLAERTRGIEVNTTNNINQMQQQTQQQQQYGQLASLIYGLGQQIRSTNEAINVGSGTLTANPSNTNTNIR